MWSEEIAWKKTKTDPKTSQTKLVQNFFSNFFQTKFGNALITAYVQTCRLVELSMEEITINYHRKKGSLCSVGLQPNFSYNFKFKNKDAIKTKLKKNNKNKNNYAITTCGGKIIHSCKFLAKLFLSGYL